jgi:putative DNA primase/helicase
VSPNSDIPAAGARSSVNTSLVEFSEDALAAEFSARHCADHRYTAAWNQWHTWDGTRWVQDTTLHVFDRVRQLCREEALCCEQPAAAKALAAAKTVAAVERLARADRAHAAEPSQWDRNDWLLNTPAGTIELRTGSLRPSRAADYLTRLTKVGPSNDAPGQWLDFLEKVTAGDGELQAFLQRIAGYCLTGDVSEHALFFLYGTGGNGKGTFLDTLTNLLGDYATVAPIDTFTATHGDRHPTDMAMLDGPRLVAAEETEKGKRWAESKIKNLTGGAPITARFMRGDFFTYDPKFKLVIAGNHQPRLTSVDTAIRRRMHMIPFTVDLTRGEIVLGFKELLVAEWPGILTWAIEGCLAWQESGLRPPQAVQDATSEYLSSQDSLQEWLDECCEIAEPLWSTSAELYRSWRAWCDAAQREPGGTKAFGEMLASHGFRTVRKHGGRGYHGLAVRLPLDVARLQTRAS